MHDLSKSRGTLWTHSSFLFLSKLRRSFPTKKATWLPDPRSVVQRLFGFLSFASHKSRKYLMIYLQIRGLSSVWWSSARGERESALMRVGKWEQKTDQEEDWAWAAWGEACESHQQRRLHTQQCVSKWALPEAKPVSVTTSHPDQASYRLFVNSHADSFFLLLI